MMMFCCRLPTVLSICPGFNVAYGVHRYELVVVCPITRTSTLLSRHRGAKPGRRCGRSGQISLLSLE